MLLAGLTSKYGGIAEGTRVMSVQFASSTMTVAVTLNPCNPVYMSLSGCLCYISCVRYSLPRSSQCVPACLLGVPVGPEFRGSAVGGSDATS
jgi:hypothetical protein